MNPCGLILTHALAGAFWVETCENGPVMKSLPLTWRATTILADSINTVSSTRKVYLLAGALALLGVALIVVTVWFWRTTRQDPEVLGPLEAMGTRRFRHMDDGAKQELLEKSRPVGAEPMKWGVVKGTAMEQPQVDLAAIGRSEPKGYDDLREPVEQGTSGELAAEPGQAADAAQIEAAPLEGEPVAAESADEQQAVADNHAGDTEPATAADNQADEYQAGDNQAGDNQAGDTETDENDADESE